MKLFMKLLMLIFGTITTIYLSSSYYSPNHVSDIVLDNIEALASSEGGGNYQCFGVGSIDCNGRKVSNVYTSFNFDYTE